MWGNMLRGRQRSAWLCKLAHPSFSQVEDGSRTWYFKRLEALKQLFPDNPEVQAWKTSPFVYVEEGGQRQFIGGCDEFMQQMSTQFPKSEGVKAAQNMMVWRDGTWTK